MYDKDTNLVNELYDGKTGQFLGYATFGKAQPEEEKILKWINYGSIPESLILLDSEIKPTTENYVPPKLTEKISRKGILHASLRDENSGVFIPVEIQFTFDVRGRSQKNKNLYQFNSVEYSNIKVERVSQG